MARGTGSKVNIGTAIPFDMAVLSYGRYKHPRMVVQEFQTVALLNQIAIGIVSKGNTILSDSSASCIVCKGVAIIARQLSAVCPSSRLASVSSRVADYIILKALAIVLAI